MTNNWYVSELDDSFDLENKSNSDLSTDNTVNIYIETNIFINLTELSVSLVNNGTWPLAYES